jgi:hypothetical protein
MYIPPAEHPSGSSVWWLSIFGVGVRLFIFVKGCTRTSELEISKDKVPRFLYLFTGGLEPTSHNTTKSYEEKIIFWTIFVDWIFL